MATTTIGIGKKAYAILHELAAQTGESMQTVCSIKRLKRTGASNFSKGRTKRMPGCAAIPKRGTPMG